MRSICVKYTVILNTVLVFVVACATSPREDRAAQLTQRPIGIASIDTFALKRVLEAGRDSLAARGISAAVILADGEMWTGQAGESTPGSPVTRDMTFDAGSVGKMFTAAIVLQLVEEDRIGLDEAIASWLPEAPNAERVTPRMLLTHTSGWPDVWDDASFVPSLAAAPTRRWTLEEVLAAMPETVNEPGVWDYSSSGYVALGLIVEKAGGATFGALVNARLLKPLGLAHTVHGAYADPPEPLAHGWLDVNQDGTPEDFTLLLPAISFRSAAGPAGGMISTAADLARFTRAFVTGELHGSIVVTDTTEWVDRPDGNRHGLGVLITELDGTLLVGHRGNSAGYSSAAWHAPQLDVTVVVLTNAHGILVTPIVSELLAEITAHRSSDATRSKN